MVRIHDLIAVESDTEAVARALVRFSSELGAAIVGAFHITCSDEAEGQCSQVFQRSFVEGQLPELKPGCRWPFRSANLGARYEWGAVGMAEEHFALSPNDLKLLVLKINAHVGVSDTVDGPSYGQIDRYGHESSCCGALAGLLRGGDIPALDELGEAFRYDGKDRVAILRDSSRVEPRHRALFAAVTNARLQARRAVEDIRQHRPKTPTVFLVLPAVTINRPDADSELVVGQYGIDWTQQSPSVKYHGLGDDPAAYRLRHQRQRAIIEDADWPAAE